MTVRSYIPRERNAETTIHVAHELDVDGRGKDAALEFLFNGIGSTEVHNVITVTSEAQRWESINDAACKDAGGIGARRQSNGTQGLGKGKEPVTRGPTKAAETFPKAPMHILL